MAETGSAGAPTTGEPPQRPGGASGAKTSTKAPKSDSSDQHDFANPTINMIRTASQKSSSYSSLTGPSREGTPPPLPPRPNLLGSRPSTSGGGVPSRPQLVSKATTQLSYTDTQTYSQKSSSSRSSASRPPRTFLGFSRGHTASDGDNESILSVAPTADAGIEAESILGDVPGGPEKSLLRTLGHRFSDQESESLFPPDPDFEDAFKHEFDEIENVKADGSNEECVMMRWRGKLKHFLILSSAGKPIYSRHGNDELITNYMGVVQTIISFYQSTSDSLKSFTAGDVRFLVMSKGPLNLVAITRLTESDSQLRAQLDALYMQILSTLTLPSMERMFAARANYDLRRPLQGTEILLSALADGFTRGSPSTLLGALECLKLRKAHRRTINNTLLKVRSENLLYGLIVASGKLVSVVRPKKHSLHPGDLHLIFNMLFEAGSVKAGGGENWIPLCLPGFNNTGYLYMYVSFLNLDHPSQPMEERPRSSGSNDDDDEVAILLISANKESFYELRAMRDELVENLQRNNSLNHLRTATRAPRPRTTDILPGTPLRHFLYKSRANVQFTMPSFAPYFASPLARRQLMNLYAKMHAQMHARPAGLKVMHETGGTCLGLGWITDMFEVYCVAGTLGLGGGGAGVGSAATERKVLASAALGVVEWVRREEERVFIIGGAVF